MNSYKYDSVEQNMDDAQIVLNDKCTICHDVKDIALFRACDECDSKCCVHCWKEWFIQSLPERKCIQCTKEYTLSKMVELVGKEWIQGEYANQQARVFVEIDEHEWPETRALLPRYCYSVVVKHRMEAARKACDELSWIWTSSETRKIMEERYNALRVEYTDVMFEIFGSNTSNKEVWLCPRNDCDGMIENDKCVSCNVVVCTTCMMMKNEFHECSMDDLNSASLIRENTKGCPRCHARIMKDKGCDQLWCTRCHVGFLWSTRAEVNKVHTPDYVEWLQTHPDREETIPDNLSELTRRTNNATFMNMVYFAFRPVQYNPTTIQQARLWARLSYLNGEMNKQKYSTILREFDWLEEHDKILCNIEESVKSELKAKITKVYQEMKDIPIQNESRVVQMVGDLLYCSTTRKVADVTAIKQYMMDKCVAESNDIRISINTRIIASNKHFNREDIKIISQNWTSVTLTKM